MKYIDEYNKLKYEIYNLEEEENLLFNDIEISTRKFNKIVNSIMFMIILFSNIIISYEVLKMNNILIAKLFALALGNFAPFYFGPIIGDIFRFKYEDKLKSKSGYNDIKINLAARKDAIKKITKQIDKDIPLIKGYRKVDNCKVYTLSKSLVRVRKK